MLTAVFPGDGGATLDVIAGGGFGIAGGGVGVGLSAAELDFSTSLLSFFDEFFT